jgi:hypothetical protein
MYKILKHKVENGVDKGHWVNDSEGIAVEYSEYESAYKIASLFQSNSAHGYTYTVVKMT